MLGTDVDWEERCSLQIILETVIHNIKSGPEITEVSSVSSDFYASYFVNFRCRFVCYVMREFGPK